MQHTLGGEIERAGIGLHSGRQVRAVLKPAGAGRGVRFVRSDLPDRPMVPARLDQVTGVEWETVLGGDRAPVHTVEHLLAALTAYGVDNLEVVLDGPEPPALDGSAHPWCEAIREVGVVRQEEEATVLSVREPLHVTEGDSRYTVLPYPRFRVSAGIDFEHPSIGRQFASAEPDDPSFCWQVAPARTFGLEAWAEPLHEKGLALGAGPENTVIVGDGGLPDGTELRFPDEFVRHKLVDLVGDLALLGARIRAHVVAERPGHRGNVALARRLAARLDGKNGTPVLDIHEVLRYMPHRYPFLLVDRVLEFEPGSRIVGLKNVTINEPFFTGHFPDHPIMPGVLVIEAMAQVGGLLLMNEFENPQDRLVYLMSLDRVKFRRPVVPGDSLLFELEMVQLRGNVCRMRGVGRVEGQIVAEAELLASVMDR